MSMMVESMTVDEATDQLAERLAALLCVDKIEAMRVALTNELQRYEALRTKETVTHPPEKGDAA